MFHLAVTRAGGTVIGEADCDNEMKHVPIS